ncbi:MAG: zinc transporter ZntB [Spirochaetaceae bacterium]|nr:zinc transporter ZntB [Spirochaetaceae bacterium]
MNTKTNFSAILIKDEGSTKNLSVDNMKKWESKDGLLWINLDYNIQETHDWLNDDSKIDSIVLEALLAEDTRPRYFIHGNGLLMILRGVNLNPGADPDDMVSLRLWVEPKRIISIWRRKVMAVEDLRNEILNGEGPKSEGEFLSHLTRSISIRMAESINNISNQVDELEEEIFEQKDKPLRTVISELRRQIIGLKRYLAPQKEIFTRIQTEEIDFFNSADLASLRETTDRLTRYVEDLDAAKERTAVAQDELVSQQTSRMNKTMYMLSIVTVIFLPLGLITGLLGINVGGIPGSDNPYAFFIVSGLLVFIAIMQILIFRRKSWV